MLRSSSRNKENMNGKGKRTFSLRRKRSPLSILPFSSSIQKPERGRSRNRLVMHDVIATNKVSTDRRNDNGVMDVEVQEEILSSEQQLRQQSLTSWFSLSQMNNNDDKSERSDIESSGEDQRSSTTSEDSIWSFFLHIGSNTYQCRVCSNVCCFCLNSLIIFCLMRTL